MVLLVVTRADLLDAVAAAVLRRQRDGAQVEELGPAVAVERDALDHVDRVVVDEVRRDDEHEVDVRHADRAVAERVVALGERVERDVDVMSPGKKSDI